MPPVATAANCVHLVLCDYGELGRRYVETDPKHADRETVVTNMIEGQYDHPLRVVALDLTHGNAIDVSREVASAVQARAGQDHLAPGTASFVDDALDEEGPR